MVSSTVFRGLTFGCQGACGVGGHDRVGPLGVPEGMLLLGQAVPLMVARWGDGAGGQFIYGTALWGVGRFGSHARPSSGSDAQLVWGRCLNTSRAT